MTRAGVLAGVAAAILLVATPVAWSRAAASARPPAAGAADGKVLFRTKGCSTCHTGPDTEAQVQFPDLSHAHLWAGLRRPGLTAEQYVRQSILDPSAFISPAWSNGGGPTPGMPQLSVSKRDADALVAYLLAR